MVKRTLILAVVFAAWSTTVLSVATGTTPIPFWHKEARKYRCAGTDSFVICHSVKANGATPYRVTIDGNVLWVSYGGKLIFDCAVRGGPELCRRYPS